MSWQGAAGDHGALDHGACCGNAAMHVMQECATEWCGFHVDENCRFLAATDWHSGPSCTNLNFHVTASPAAIEAIE